MLGKRIAVCVGAAFVALAAGSLADFGSDAAAAEIKRVRCRVSDRLQVSVDLRDIAAGIASVQVSIANESATGKTALPIDGLVNSEGDAQVEWDSNPNPADPAEGQRASIDRDFASVGHTIRASALGLSATATCASKK